MSTSRRPHVPIVEIVTPSPDAAGATPGILTTVRVDGREWAAVSYRIDSVAGDVQKVTLTFLADVTVTHSDGVVR